MSELIERQAAIDALHTWFRDGFDEDKWWNSTHVLAAIEGLHPVQQEHKWETCFECPLSHGCPKIKGCTNEQAIEYASQIPNDCPLSAQPEPQWISVTERLPDNADHPGAFCPRYQVVTPYGVTEGWYRPHDHEKGGQWFALFWFMSQIYEIWNIDFERGDVPKVIGEAPVMEWRPLPEPYKPNK